MRLEGGFAPLLVIPVVAWALPMAQVGVGLALAFGIASDHEQHDGGSVRSFSRLPPSSNCSPSSATGRRRSPRIRRRSQEISPQFPLHPSPSPLCCVCNMGM